MRTVLVTVKGPQRTIDLELPGDTPISELFPLLVMVSAPQLGHASDSTQQWRLGLVNGTPLLPNRTLIEGDIVDGCMLLFQEAGAWARHVAAAGPVTPVPAQSKSQATDTGGIGIRWNKEDLLS
jgi:hypothetical protein